MGKTIHLDDREFIGLTQQMSAAQEDYVAIILSDAGAMPTIAEISRAKPDVADDAKRTKLADDLRLKIVRKGMTFKLLAGLLTEQGKKWRQEDAVRNAERFGDITNPEEKALMRDQLITLVFAFFPSGEASSTTSPKSSNPSETAPGISSEEVAISASSAQ